MVSPEYIGNHKPENQQAHSPAVEQHVKAEGEKKRTWLKLLMRVLGVVVPLVGGFAMMFLTISIVDSFWELPVAFLLGVVGALLFRSWWAILVVLLAYSFGEFLAWQIAPGVLSPDSLFFTDDVALGTLAATFAGAFLAMIGALIGAASVRWRALHQGLTK